MYIFNLVFAYFTIIMSQLSFTTYD